MEPGDDSDDARYYATLYRQVMDGTESWANTSNKEYVNGKLTVRRIGLLGLGHINQRLIELLQPFRVDIMACDPFVDEELVSRLGIARGELDAVLEHAQILVVQVPYTPKIEKMIGARELELLGKGSIIVKCSRGKVVDQPDLAEKVEDGDLIAGLDVFEVEPIPKGGSGTADEEHGHFAACSLVFAEFTAQVLHLPGRRSRALLRQAAAASRIDGTHDGNP